MTKTLIIGCAVQLILIGLVNGKIHQPSKISQLMINFTRNEILKTENNLATGGSIILTEKEQCVDNIIKELKLQEINDGFANLATYAPSNHFFKVKKLIEKSEIFRIIKIMPKGSILHVHSATMASPEWIIKNITYHPLLLKCTNEENKLILTFRKTRLHNCTNYDSVTSDRNRSGNPAAYDAQLEHFINLYTPNPDEEYPNGDAIWTRFDNIFKTISEVVQNVDIFKLHTNRILQESYDDNVQYIEFRTEFPQLYDNSGKEYSNVDTAKIFTQIVSDFKITHPDFIGAKFIFSAHRLNGPKYVNVTMKIFKELYASDPAHIIGYDLAGHEDLGQPLINSINELNQIPDGAQFFFHAGETNWYGTSVDENILDAILLGTSRIGHGYGVVKHPALMKTIKQQDIPIEVSPLSNQVLHLVHDLRNHPAVIFYSENIPHIISNDDPGFWDAKGLSYDFYYAFMCFTPANIGLTYLKQIALNSIRYAVLTDPERTEYLNVFNHKWEIFLNNVLNGKF